MDAHTGHAGQTDVGEQTRVRRRAGYRYDCEYTSVAYGTRDAERTCLDTTVCVLDFTHIDWVARCSTGRVRDHPGCSLVTVLST